MTNLLPVVIAAVITLLAIFIFIKSRKPKKLNQAENVEAAQTISSMHNSLSEQLKELKELAKSAAQISAKESGIRPEGNQQRNLDREVGGTEEGKIGAEQENKELQEQHIKDAWDERSEEVDKMGSHVPLKGSSKESMLWRLKKAKLEAKKAMAGIGAGLATKSVSGKEFDSSKQQGGFGQMIKAKQDRGNDLGGGGKGGGAWR